MISINIIINRSCPENQQDNQQEDQQELVPVQVMNYDHIFRLYHSVKGPLIFFHDDSLLKIYQTFLFYGIKSGDTVLAIPYHKKIKKDSDQEEYAQLQAYIYYERIFIRRILKLEEVFDSLRLRDLAMMKVLSSNRHAFIRVTSLVKKNEISDSNGNEMESQLNFTFDDSNYRQAQGPSTEPLPVLW